MKNKRTQELIQKVYEKANDSPFWKRVAKELGKPRRSQKGVNLSKLSKLTKANDKVLVLGKVLGTGELEHSLTIVAFSFSETAKKKLKDATLLSDFIDKKSNPKGMRLIK